MEQNIYRRLKVTNSKLFNRNNKLKRLLVLNVIITVLCITGTISFATLFAKEKFKTNSLENTVREQSERLVSYETQIEEQKNSIQTLSKVAVVLDNENSELVATLKTAQEELDKYKEREELYDKYEYAIIRSDGTRTDINYDDIKTLEELAKEEGLGKDTVSMILAISMNESMGFADIKSKSSSAAGLCGLLNSTAKYSWEVLMDNGIGTYKSSYVYDSLNNLEMALQYVAYLKEHTNSNYELLVAYRGLDDTGYIKKISKYTGKQINDLDL